MASNIGQWVRRIKGDRRYQQTNWHHVESEIEDRVVTKCGRQMKRVVKTAYRDNTLEFQTIQPSYYATCIRCYG